jgi:hypothetical protein
MVNKNGVIIGLKYMGHWAISNASCCCGNTLVVCPQIYGTEHTIENPIIVCTDFGSHAFEFKDLELGQQVVLEYNKPQ